MATSLAIPEAAPTIPVLPFQGGPPPVLEIEAAPPPGEAAYPLAWSPDGAALIALLPTGRLDTDGRPMGRLVVLDAFGTLTWDSGDIEAPIGGPAPGDWLADGTLALARRDGTFARADGSQSSTPPGLEGQPREVWVDPRRQRALLLGPRAAQIVSPGQPALRLGDWPAEDERGAARPGFAWSPDGSRIALSAADGRHTLFDATSGASVLLLQDGSSPWPSGSTPSAWPAPAWLADGRLLLGTETWYRYRDGDTFDHRIVNTSSAQVSPMAEAYGLPASGRSLAARASADGRYVLRTSRGASGAGGDPSAERSSSAADGAGGDPSSASAGRSWLIVVPSGEARPLPDLGDPRWSPSSERFLRMDAAGVALVTRLDASGALAQTPIPLAGGGALLEARWSPDGRWLVVLLEDGSLELVDAGGASASLALGRLGPDAGQGLHAAWSPDGRRLALRVHRPERGGAEGRSDSDADARLYLLRLAP